MPIRKSTTQQWPSLNAIIVGLSGWMKMRIFYVSFFFDFSKAFDTVPHDVVCNKLKALDINPYITNWIINFLYSRKQRVVVDGVTTEFLSINKGVPQGSVLDPVLFALMVNDIRQLLPERNLLIKFADDTNLSVPVKVNCDTSHIEVNNIES